MLLAISSELQRFRIVTPLCVGNTTSTNCGSWVKQGLSDARCTKGIPTANGDVAAQVPSSIRQRIAFTEPLANRDSLLRINARAAITINRAGVQSRKVASISTELQDRVGANRLRCAQMAGRHDLIPNGFLFQSFFSPYHIESHPRMIPNLLPIGLHF